MVTEIGIRILVPIMVFGFLIVGSYLMADWSFQDVLKRRNAKK